MRVDGIEIGGIDDMAGWGALFSSCSSEIDDRSIMQSRNRVAAPGVASKVEGLHDALVQKLVAGLKVCFFFGGGGGDGRGCIYICVCV